MEVKNCRRCRKLFNYTSGPQICPVCHEELEKKFVEVKEYIREHADANVNTVAKECGVDKNQIGQWIREERLIFAEGAGVDLTCEKCGASINTGRFCEKCKGEMANGLMNSIARQSAPAAKPEKKSAGGPRMHFLDR